MRDPRGSGPMVIAKTSRRRCFGCRVWPCGTEVLGNREPKHLAGTDQVWLAPDRLAVQVIDLWPVVPVPQLSLSNERQ